MNEDLKKLGAYLEQVRQGMDLTLKDVEGATSIRFCYLEAIEKGSAEEHLSQAYVHGFIRQYVQFLGLDLDDLMRDFPGAFRLCTEKHDFAYGIGTLEMRGSAHGGVKWVPNLVWGATLALIIIAGWYFGKFLGLY